LPLRFEVLEDRSLLSAFATTDYIILPHAGGGGGGGVTPYGSPSPTGLTPTQVRHAYGFDQLALDGTGTTIAIVDAFDDPKIATDLIAFDAQWGIPNPVFTKVNQTGGSTPPAANGGWASEIALDVEWSHVIAPGAKILLVEANDNSFNNLLTAVSYAASQTNVVAISMSWGGGEFSGENSFDSTFVTPSGHTGITFVASSGDNGAPPGYPAISPNVLSAGGTTLNVDSSGNYISESGWSGSGGGISSQESQPTYQKGVVTQSSTARTNPDIGYDSDPNTGFPVYDTFNNSASAPWSQFGGTSAASPQWAALIALVDQGRMAIGSTPLDGPTQTLPKIYQLAQTAPGDFNDIKTGGSLGSPHYNCGPGYDLVTGIGSPVANKLVTDLVGAPAATHFAVSAPASATAGIAFTVTVTALDQNNNTVPGYTGTVHFSSSDTSAGLPSNYTFTSGDAGVHTLTNGVTLKKAGSQTVTATDTATATITGSATVTVTAASANHVGFLQQPTNTAAGNTIAPAVTVEIFDAFNNPEATDNSESVTLAIGTNPGSGTLSGALTQTVSNGVATFSNLSINKTGIGYTLQASSGALTGATSAAFNITPGAASQLIFGQQPTNTPAGSTINPAVTVRILDANSNLVTTDNTDQVTIAIGSNPGGATLSGTQTVTAQNGLATFSNLSLNLPGTGYTLTASSGSLAGATSASFNITAAGTHLFFGQQPTNTAAGAAINPAVVIQVLDASNNVVTTDNSDLISIIIGANPGGGTLSGTTTLTVTAGVATFSNLSINKTGVGYTLTATSGALTSATSAAFTVTPGAPTRLAFSQQPTNTVAGAAIAPPVTVQILDANNNLVTTDSTDSITIAIGTNPGGGTLSGAASAVASNGVASFGNLSINKTGTGYTLQAGSGSLTGATSSSFNITPGVATHLAFAQQPTSTTVGASITPAVTVQVLDANNNLVTTDSTDQVTLALAANPGGATLSGTNPVTVSGGVATFSNLSLNQPGTGYTLSASSGSLGSATSASFNVTAVATKIIEDFEHGLGSYLFGYYTFAATTTAAVHDGTYGLDMGNSYGWIFRNDSGSHVQQGETISVWEKFSNVANGRAYFGFGATKFGALSVVLAANTNQMIIQDNSDYYNYSDVASVSQSYQANHWYLVQIAWGTGGAITARLYDSDGVTLLNTVKGTDNNIAGGGIGFRAINNDKYFDTVTMTPGAMLQSQQFGANGISQSQSPEAPTQGVISDRLGSPSFGKDLLGASKIGPATNDSWSVSPSVWTSSSSRAAAGSLVPSVATANLQGQQDSGFVGLAHATAWDMGFLSAGDLADDENLLSSAIEKLVRN
jgi:subtilase family serine protease